MVALMLKGFQSWSWNEGAMTFCSWSIIFLQWIKHPLDTDSFVFRDLFSYLSTITDFIISMMKGIRVASPKSSISKSSPLNLSFDANRICAICDMMDSLSFANSSRSIFLLKSWPSINESTLISVSSLLVSCSLPFFIASSSLSFESGCSKILILFFFWNS